jgi:L-lactate dehydrogenase
MNNKVVVIGCGNVGMSYAYALLNQNTLVTDLALIDLDKERITGEVMDLNHCLPYAPSHINIKVGDYPDCKNAKIVVIAAGANQAPGETRMDLINKNSKIFKVIINSVMASGFKGVFVVATNPLDVMTYLTYKYSELPPNQIIGSGTSLDTARMRYIVGTKLNINPKNIHGYVIGEHGDSEFIPWSNVNIGLQNINDFLSPKEMKRISLEVKNAAYEIIAKKGATCYGIGMCLVRITNAILGNEKSVLVVSTYDDTNDIYLGLPVILGKNGVCEKIYFTLNKEETNKLQVSINVIKKAIKKVD